MNSFEEKNEENPKSQPDVDFIPYGLLEESGKLFEGVFGSVHECIYTPTNEKSALFMLVHNKPHYGQVTTEIPESGLGSVYECINERTGKKMTLKLLLPKPEERYNNEFVSGFRWKHENIIRIYGRTCVGGVNGILTEWVEGTSFKQVIHDKSISYSFGDVLRWNIQSFRALEYVIQTFPGRENEHFRQYFHRIVCPENMILNPTRDVLKICALGPFKDSNGGNFSDYWAPEVRKGKYRYEESDVYPFGKVLWECLTRKNDAHDEPRSLSWPVLSNNVENGSLMFRQFMVLCTFEEPKTRLSVSVINTILRNMVLAKKGEKLDIFKKNYNNIICFWNKEELYYCTKLISFEFLMKNHRKIFNFSLLKNRTDLASGSFGTVCSAEYEGQKIAVKFQGATKMEPFLQEFDTLNSLKHENIVKVIGQTEKDGVYGVVMEFIDGTSLDKTIYETSAKYTLGDVLKWNYQAASALEYMHSFRLLHRDIKPDNMVIETSEKRTLKIVDLGGAKKIQNLLNVTKMGTNLYIAPEIDKDDGYDEQCDVYSWTITFWECLTAERPQRPPDYRSKVNRICSAKFVENIEQCSSSNPSDRKPMFILKKWLGDMLNNRAAFTDTDSTFRENHICVWNEQNNELYYFPESESEKQFKAFAEAKTLFTNAPMDAFNIIQDLGDENGNVKLIEVADPQLIPCNNSRSNDELRNIKRQKVVKFSKDIDEKCLENEFVILSKLKHENIVKLLGYTHDNQLNYFGIITDVVDGLETLEKVISSRWCNTKEIVQYGLLAARGLEYLHTQNILHCDIKPANILIAEEQCKICDFNLSRDLQYTHPKEAVDTGIYMAPEMRRDGALTTKSDVYSWTVTFWESCRWLNLSNYIFKTEDIRQMESIDLCETRYRIENASDKFNEFIQTCANADPDKRWSMTDIVTLLENMMENHSNSSYVPDWDNIEDDIVAKENICLWNSEFNGMRSVKKNFCYASADSPLDLQSCPSLNDSD